jgi:small subunit ribosomal protein S20
VRHVIYFADRTHSNKFILHLLLEAYTIARFLSSAEQSNMANSAQARKRARQAVQRRALNMSQRSELRTAVKSVRKAIAAGDKAAAQAVFKQSMSVIDRIADKGIVHKNAASRNKSRLSAAVKAL